MKRRPQTAADSMDLLLDTITNTFGGVLLLALLLILLIRDFSESSLRRSAAESELSAEQQRLTQQIAQAAAQRDILRQSLDASQLIDFRDEKDEKSPLFAALVEQAARLGSLKADAARFSRDGAELQRELAELVGRKESLQGERERVQNALSAAEESLKKEIAARTRTMDVPREDETAKTPVVAIVKGNELFLVNDHSSTQGFRFNTEHFTPSSGRPADLLLANGTELTIRAGKGIALDPNRLGEALARLDAQRQYLAIVVAGDSFDQFANVRTAVVARHLDHRIYPWERFPVVEGSSYQRATAQ